MTNQKYSFDIISAVAESLASIDGKLELFTFEEDFFDDFEDSVVIDAIDGYNTGTYERYMTKAEEAINQINVRGYAIVPTNHVEIKSV